MRQVQHGCDDDDGRVHDMSELRLFEVRTDLGRSNSRSRVAHGDLCGGDRASTYLGNPESYLGPPMGGMDDVRDAILAGCSRALWPHVRAKSRRGHR
jgi:hypothetical protein